MTESSELIFGENHPVLALIEFELRDAGSQYLASIVLVAITGGLYSLLSFSTLWHYVLFGAFAVWTAAHVAISVVMVVISLIFFVSPVTLSKLYTRFGE